MRHGWLLALLLVPLPSQAQTIIETIRYNSGTGFFVSPQGHLLTNAHVVKGCTQYSFYTPKAILRATLISVDKRHDLALLKSELPPQSFAEFRDLVMPLEEGKKVVILGYPMETVKTRRPVLRTSRLVSLGGPNDEPEFIQFSNSMQQGNSGGPLLDDSGNVIGVVSAKSKITAINPETQAVKSVQVADVAVAPQTVMQFLREMDVPYQETMSDKPLSSKEIAKDAGNFVVNVRCRIN